MAGSCGKFMCDLWRAARQPSTVSVLSFSKARNINLPLFTIATNREGLKTIWKFVDFYDRGNKIELLVSQQSRCFVKQVAIKARRNAMTMIETFPTIY